MPRVHPILGRIIAPDSKKATLLGDLLQVYRISNLTALSQRHTPF